MKLNILKKERKKEREKEIKYIFNKYKRWIKLENKKEIYYLFVRTSKNLITIQNFILENIQKILLYMNQDNSRITFTYFSSLLRIIILIFKN